MNASSMQARAGPPAADRARRAKLNIFLKLRHHIEHRYLPVLDNEVVGEAQALLVRVQHSLTAGEYVEGQSARGAMHARPGTSVMAAMVDAVGHVREVVGFQLQRRIPSAVDGGCLARASSVLSFDIPRGRVE